jgi:NAD(P)-dependent dehydrogenase (short-subunit alcohol dehydrogenase family)
MQLHLPRLYRHSCSQRYFATLGEPDTQRARHAARHSLGRLSRPEEVAALAAFLAGDESSFCTGQPFIVDGELTAGRPAQR